MAEITRIPAGLNITAGVGDALMVAVTVTKNGTPFDLSGWTLEAENATLTILDAEQGELQLAFTADKPQTRAWFIRRVSPQPKKLIAGFVVFTTTAGDSTADALTLQLEDGEDELTLEIFDPVQGLQPGDNVSELVNDAGYITSGEAPVQSVNGFTGDVSLTLDDILDVSVTSPNLNDLLNFDGSDWVLTDTPTVRGLQLDTTNPADAETGRIIWNDGDQVPQFVSNGVTVDLSMEMLARCRNVTGSMIPKGTAVCIVGASAQRISIAPSDRTQLGSACRTLGVTLEEIQNNQFGKVSTFGLVRGLNTAGIDGEEGDELFVGATPGSLSTVPPEAPARRLSVGYLVTKNINTGRIFVTIKRGVKVDEIDDVEIESITEGDVIRYDATAGRWENTGLGTAADADVGDFDPAGSASGVQSNLDSHTGATTNVHGIADTADLIIEGDARLSDARTPLTHGNEAHAEDYVDAAGAAAAAPVQSVNTQTGAVTLDAGDVGADPAGSASSVQSNLTTHIQDDTNPHQVTATQVGLGNVDNTADLDKPVSTAAQSALNDKADKTTEIIAGTGLDGGGDLSENRTLNLDSATVLSLGKADTALQAGDNVSELTNDAAYITLTDLSASGDLIYDNQTGNFSVTTYKSGDFDADFSGKNTDNLNEGIANLYFTTARIDSHLSGGNGIDYTNGVISIDSATQSEIAGKADDADISIVGKTGSYNDLLNKPDLSVLEEVLTFPTLGDFPATGETGKVYIAEDTGFIYRWSGLDYVQLTDQTAIWGQISGTLSNQTDLQNALNAKPNDADIAVVGKSGSYTDLLNTPTNLSDFNNDQNFITLNDLSASGDLSYNSSTGVFSFTQRTDQEVRNLFSASGDLSYNNATGVFSVTTYKSTDFDNDFAGKDTGDLTEGTNLYFTTQRIDSHLAGGTGIDYSAGNISLDASTTDSLGLADTALQAGDNISVLTNDAQYINSAGAPVQSVNTQTGVVVLDKGDVGLVNVDNTSDADKPVSTATQSALDAKVDKVIEIIAGTGLNGGGDLSASRTIDLNLGTVASLELANTALQSGDNISELNNDANYIDVSGAPVQSVNTQTGNVVLDKSDVGLSNVDNVSASELRDRSTHTGTQAISTVTGLQNALDLKANDAEISEVGKSGSYNDLTNTPTIGNGALSMGTSGIATGSASFTANQTGGSTFTVDVPGTNLGSSGTGETRNITSSTGSNTSITYTAQDLNAVPTSRTISTGNGLTGGGNLTANRTFAVDGTVVRNTTSQTINGNLTLSSNGFIRVPVGTTAQRPTPQAGMIRFNTTRGCFEGYNGNAWINMTPINFDDVGS